MLRWLSRILGLSGQSDTSSHAAVEFPELNFPFETVVVSGQEATSEREARTTAGHKAVVMGSAEDLALLSQIIEESDEAVDVILQHTDSVDLESWNASRSVEDEEYWSPQSAPWPDSGVSAIEPGLHLEVFSGKPKRQVIIGILEVDEAWQVPAWLHYGGWNDCPSTEVHCALHRKWAREFGAEIVSISSDVIECHVKRRPESREEAMALARQQFLYCPDIVHQGVQSIEALAATLMVSDYWYFWWD